MYCRKSILSFLIVIYCTNIHSQTNSLLPLPTIIRLENKNVFNLSNNTTISTDIPEANISVAVFIDYVRKWKDITLSKTAEKSSSKNIILLKRVKQIDTSGYQLNIDKNKIVVSADSKSGFGNALSTLLQLIVTSQSIKNISIPCTNVKDYAKYSWRGFMLDESRHFFGKEEVKKILDQMYLFKLNRFHWHLTDEPAWRMEIKKYPLLTAVGARGNYSDSTAQLQFYTQNDINEIVAYAADRNIVVIPEIDMPGHATAANKAYPQYSGGGSAKHPDFTFNPGKEDVYSFLTEILKETKTLFPSSMVHLGGDEVSFGNEKWNTDTAIARLKKDNKLSTNIDVEYYFLKRMADSANKIGMKILGWDEMTDAHLSKDSTILMWWRHDKTQQLRTALNQGYQVILCPRIPLYFDFVQIDRDKDGRRWGKDFGTYDDLFSFPPDTLIAPLYKNQILGMQGNLWTEKVQSKKRLEYLIFPRLMAMASAAWSSQKLSLKDFANKVTQYYPLWKKLDISYLDILHPENTPEISDESETINYLDNK